MLQLAQPKAGDIIIDPMCGGGSIPIEVYWLLLMLYSVLPSFMWTQKLNTVFIHNHVKNVFSLLIKKLATCVDNCHNPKERMKKTLSISMNFCMMYSIVLADVLEV
jgi:23S rRNA G2445 N2-methylase RlmL